MWSIAYNQIMIGRKDPRKTSLLGMLDSLGKLVVGYFVGSQIGEVARTHLGN